MLILRLAWVSKNSEKWGGVHSSDHFPAFSILTRISSFLLSFKMKDFVCAVSSLGAHAHAKACLVVAQKDRKVGGVLSSTFFKSLK
jgi:hypothetical protein